MFWHLTVADRSIEEISKREKLPLEKMDSFLRKLESIDLIQVSKNGKIRKMHSGLVRWNNDSPLVKKINQEWSRSTLEKVLQNPSEEAHFHRLSFLRLVPESRETFYEELNQIITKYARLSSRERVEKKLKDLQPLSLLIAISPTEFTR